MARSVVGYIRQYLNSSASASPTGSAEPVTSLPIGTGINPGVFQEFSDSEALQYSSRGVVGVQILTAGSGQTNGTYTAAASAGGAVINYTVSGGAVTAVSVNTPGGPYTDAAIPTFTIAAGGTPGTVSVAIGVLYSGVYAWAALDPAVTGSAIAVGTPLFWLQSAASPTVTTVVSANYPDFAGVSIDPNFGPANPYAFIQQNGKARCIFLTGATGPAAYGDTLNLATAGTGFTTTSGQSTFIPLTVGYALATATAPATALGRITRYPSRY